MDKLAFLILFGLGWVVIGGYPLLKLQGERLRCTKRATGKIVDIRNWESYDDSGRYRTSRFPVVRYTAADGQSYLFRSKVPCGASREGARTLIDLFAFTGKKPLATGDKVEVRYDPSDPWNAYIAGGLSMTLVLPAVAVILGLVLIVRGLLSL